MVDFIILVERNSNTTKNTIIATLIDGNSTGTLGFALSGDISINEITELSTTDIPTSKAAREGKKVFLNKYSGTIQNHQWSTKFDWIDELPWEFQRDQVGERPREF